MTINWYGQSCFQIISSQNKNHQVNVLIDPFTFEETGLKVPQIKADIVLMTHGHNNSKLVIGEPFIINNPGEYEVKDVFIQGVPCFHDSTASKEKNLNVIYTLETENLRICHLGSFNQKELSSEQLEKIAEVDILMIPIGGNDTISSKEAIKIMAQIEPSIIIPMCYQLPKLKIHPVKSCKAGISSKTKSFNGVKLDGLDKFLKVMGIKKIEPMSKFSIKKKDIVPEEAKIIILNP